MGRELKKFVFDDGQSVAETVCGEYVCRYCGAKAAACNYVGDICLQVYTRHEGLCGAYEDSDRYSGYINDCATCKHQGPRFTCLHGEA